LAQSSRFRRSTSGPVGLSVGFASRRSPVRSRYAPSREAAARRHFPSETRCASEVLSRRVVKKWSSRSGPGVSSGRSLSAGAMLLCSGSSSRL
jgi:hypothetical protein